MIRPRLHSRVVLLPLLSLAAASLLAPAACVGNDDTTGKPQATVDAGGTSFTFTASRKNLEVAPGASIEVELSVSPTLPEAAELSLEGLPTGVTATFDPAKATASSRLKLTAAADAKEGSFGLVARAKVGDKSAEASITLVVKKAGTTTVVASIVADPASVALKASGTAEVSVRIVRPTGNDNGPVQVTMVDLPAFVSAEALTIGAGQTTGKLRVRATHRVAVGQSVNAKLQALGASGNVGLALSAPTNVADGEFGDGGVATQAPDGGGTVGDLIDGVMTGDEKVVFITNGDGARGWEVHRLTPEGLPDPTWGGTGVVSTPIDPNNSFKHASARGVAVQPDGKVIVAAYTYEANEGTSNPDIAVARYNIDGSLDSTWGAAGDGGTASGIAVLPRESSYSPPSYFFSGEERIAVAVSPLSTGPKVVVGVAMPILYDSGEGFYPHDAVILHGLDNGGGLLASYGEGGRIGVDTEGLVGGTGEEHIGGIAFQPGGEQVVVYQVRNFEGAEQFQVARFTATGQLDTSFGEPNTETGDRFGVNSYRFVGNNGSSIVRAVAVQPDGRILVAGSVDDNGESTSMALLRLNANGDVDTSFGGTGTEQGDETLDGGTRIVRAATDGGSSLAHHVVITNDGGRILLTGQSMETDQSHGLSVGLTSTGTMDTTFGSQGRRLLDRQTLPFRILVAPNGRLVTVGLYLSDGNRSHLQGFWP